MGAAADIAVVGAVDAVKQQLALIEHRPDDGYVRKMAATEIGVVQDEQVPLGHVPFEILADGGPGDGQGADVHWDSLSLGDKLAFRVQDSGGEVPAGVENLRHGGAQHHLGHLQGDRFQAVLDYC